MVADWVHCNRCTAAPSPGRSRRYFITSCRHVLCERCVSTASSADDVTICTACTQPARLTEISASMPANLRALFREPSGIAAEFQKNFTTVTAFQKEQRKRMQKLAQSNRKRQMEEPSNATNRAPKRAQNNEAEIQVLVTEIAALRRENNRLRFDPTRSANARYRRAVSPTPTSGSYTRARARTSTSTRSRSMPRARSVVEENEGFFNGLDSLGNSMLTSSSSFDVPKTPLWR